MIEFYHSTCKLNIACNPKIGMRGWQALCRMLRKTPCLTYLDARRTLLTDMTMPTFGRCLKADPPLKILHLEGVFLSGRPMLILSMSDIPFPRSSQTMSIWTRFFNRLPSTGRLH